MVEENYVSFDTAKLLKEKGFDWLESPFYSEQDRDEWIRNDWYSIPNPCYDENIPFDTPKLYVTAPHISIQMAMKWLRNIHGLFIHIDVIREASCWLADIQDIKGDVNVYTVENEFPNYEEACEAAIKYCLENLI